MGDESSPNDSPHLDPSDLLLPVSEDLIPTRQYTVANETAHSFDGLLNPPLVLKEDPQEGCGGHLWPAGMILSKYMLRNHRSDLRGKTIIELGAGSGLVGLAVAKGCDLDSPMYITDQTPMLPLIRQNIELNELSHKPVQAALLDWGEMDTINSFPQPAVILAADCVYFEPAFPLLLATLETLLGDETVCYFCFKKRRKADFRFLRQAQKKFNMTQVTEGINAEYCRKESIYLYVMTKRLPSEQTQAD